MAALAFQGCRGGCQGRCPHGPVPSRSASRGTRAALPSLSPRQPRLVRSSQDPAGNAAPARDGESGEQETLRNPLLPQTEPGGSGRGVPKLPPWFCPPFSQLECHCPPGLPAGGQELHPTPSRRPRAPRSPAMSPGMLWVTASRAAVTAGGHWCHPSVSNRALRVPGRGFSWEAGAGCAGPGSPGLGCPLSSWGQQGTLCPSAPPGHPQPPSPASPSRAPGIFMQWVGIPGGFGGPGYPRRGGKWGGRGWARPLRQQGKVSR